MHAVGSLAKTATVTLESSGNPEQRGREKATDRARTVQATATLRRAVINPGEKATDQVPTVAI